MTLRFFALLVIVAVTAVTLIAGGARQVAAEDRTSRRAAELSLPDPYLDPAFPEQAGEEMDGRYAPGKSDSVEEVPLDEDPEMQDEQRALEEMTGDAPSAPPSAVVPRPAPSPVPAGTGLVPGATAAGEAGNGIEQAPDEKPDGDDSGDDVDDSPDIEERDPVEW